MGKLMTDETLVDDLDTTAVTLKRTSSTWKESFLQMWQLTSKHGARVLWPMTW